MNTTVTMGRILAVAALLVACASFFISGPLVAIAVILLAIAVIVG